MDKKEADRPDWAGIGWEPPKEPNFSALSFREFLEALPPKSKITSIQVGDKILRFDEPNKPAKGNTTSRKVQTG